MFIVAQVGMRDRVLLGMSRYSTYAKAQEHVRLSQPLQDTTLEIWAPNGELGMLRVELDRCVPMGNRQWKLGVSAGVEGC